MGIVLDDVIACLDELIKVVIPNLDLPEGVELPEINSFEELLQIVTEDDTFDLDAILKDENADNNDNVSIVTTITR